MSARQIENWVFREDRGSFGGGVCSGESRGSGVERPVTNPHPCPLATVSVDINRSSHIGLPEDMVKPRMQKPQGAINVSS